MRLPPKVAAAAVWAPAILWAGLIFGLSSNPSPPQPPGVAGLPLADKLEHFAAYGILSALVLVALRLSHRTAGWGAAALDPLVAVAIASIYGATDEVHQLFVPQRTADLFDWLADTLAAIVVMAALAPHISPRPEPIEPPARGVDLPEGRVALIDEGEGPAVVYLHGWRGSKRFFRDGPRLVPGRRHIMIDLLGFGDSEKPARFGYSLADHAQVVFEAMNALGVKKAAVVGHSMGGAVALEVARTHPEAVERLVLVEPAIRAKVPLPSPLPGEHAGEFLQLAMQLSRGNPTGLPFALARLPEPLRAQFLRDAAKAPAFAAGRSLAGLVGHPAEATAPKPAGVPTLLIFGDEKFDVRAAYAKALAELLAAQVVHIPNTSHCPMIEDPPAFWMAVSKFLDEGAAP